MQTAEAGDGGMAEVSAEAIDQLRLSFDRQSLIALNESGPFPPREAWGEGGGWGGG